MIELNRLYDNLFFPLETTESNFVEGTDRHIALLMANNPGGIYDLIIQDTKQVQSELKKAISKRDSEGTEQEGSTKTMKNAFDAFIKFIRIREGLIKSTFNGDDTPEYEEFFPQGLNEYNTATLATIETLMDRCVNKATKYESELGTAFKADCISKRDDFKAAREEQLLNIGQSSNLVHAVQQALEAAGKRLAANLHTTALQNIGVPNAADIFFDQYFFVSPEQSGLYTGENKTDQTKTVRSQGWSASKTIKVTNQGTADFFIGFMNADGVAVADGKIITAGQTDTYPASSLGYNVTMHFLNITPAPGNGAKWKVEVS